VVGGLYTKQPTRNESSHVKEKGKAATVVL
jgi:hypothetical protein